MNDYWINQAAQAEASLDLLRSQYEQMKFEYEQRIKDLEAQVFKANCMAQAEEIKYEHVQ